MKPKKVLIMIHQYSAAGSKNWNFFRDAVARHLGGDIEVVMGALRDLTFELSATGSRVYDRKRGFSLDDFDLVVFRITRREYARAASCASFLLSKGIPYIDSQIQPAPWSKYAAQAMRQAEGMPTIPSITATMTELRYMVEHDLVPFGYPLIIKDNNGKKGRLNFIAHTKAEAVDILERNPDVDFIVQECIENDGDYRLLVIGGEVVLAIHRQAQNGSHLNNTSQGAVAELTPVESFESTALNDVCRATAIEYLEVAGVDVVICKKTGTPYVIEVNSSPQLATGAFPELKLQAYTDYLRAQLS